MAEEPKVKKARKPSKRRIAKAIEAFIETLPSFCETALSNGKRSGSEWVVGDMQNSPGGSCSVNLETGKFLDRANTAVRGDSPVTLVGTVCGLTDYNEIIAGMEVWVKDNTLPNGTQGVFTGKLTLAATGELLEALDDAERRLINSIR